MIYKNCPVCNVTECFGYAEGHCVILVDNNFNGKSCPFFKTQEQVEGEKEYCQNRLADIRRGNKEEQFMLNHVCLQGRICNDIELRRTGSGVAVSSFTLAVDRDFKSGGEKETDFFDIVCWRNTAEFVSKYFGKGKMATVSGRLQGRSWTDAEGHKRKAVEIVADSVYFGERKDSASTGYENPNPHIQAEKFITENFASIEGDYEELPF